MKEFCWKCPGCGEVGETREVEQPWCPWCGDTRMIRDYRAESVGIGSGVRASREG